MIDHLPECTPHIPGDLRGDMCICDRLIACEERVLTAADMPRSEWERELVSRTLDAAREAVERVSTLFEPLGPALAAIDGLRANNP